MIEKVRDPREAFVIMVFLEELIYQCHCAIDSYNELHEAIFSISVFENEHSTSMSEKMFGMKSMKEVLAVLASKDQNKIEELIAEARKRATVDESISDFNQYWEKYESMHRKLQRSIEYLVLHAGKLALLLFPAGSANLDLNTEPGRRTLRGKVLRAVTNTKSASPLANRALRNTYEHYDERLDLILASVGAYSHRRVGNWYPIPKSQSSGFVFDTNSGDVYFLNRKATQEGFNLKPMLEEIDRLMKRSNEFLRSLSGLEENLGREGVIKYIDELIKSCDD